MDASSLLSRARSKVLEKKKKKKEEEGDQESAVSSSVAVEIQTLHDNSNGKDNSVAERDDKDKVLSQTRSLSTATSSSSSSSLAAKSLLERARSRAVKNPQQDSTSENSDHHVSISSSYSLKVPRGSTSQQHMKKSGTVEHHEPSIPNTNIVISEKAKTTINCNFILDSRNSRQRSSSLRMFRVLFTCPCPSRSFTTSYLSSLTADNVGLPKSLSAHVSSLISQMENCLQKNSTGGAISIFSDLSSLFLENGDDTQVQTSIRHAMTASGGCQLLLGILRDQNESSSINKGFEVVCRVLRLENVFFPDTFSALLESDLFGIISSMSDDLLKSSSSLILDIFEIAHYLEPACIVKDSKLCKVVMSLTILSSEGSGESFFKALSLNSSIVASERGVSGLMSCGLMDVLVMSMKAIEEEESLAACACEILGKVVSCDHFVQDVFATNTVSSVLSIFSKYGFSEKVVLHSMIFMGRLSDISSKFALHIVDEGFMQPIWKRLLEFQFIKDIFLAILYCIVVVTDRAIEAEVDVGHLIPQSVIASLVDQFRVHKEIESHLMICTVLHNILRIGEASCIDQFKIYNFCQFIFSILQRLLLPRYECSYREKAVSYISELISYMSSVSLDYQNRFISLGVPNCLEQALFMWSDEELQLVVLLACADVYHPTASIVSIPNDEQLSVSPHFVEYVVKIVCTNTTSASNASDQIPSVRVHPVALGIICSDIACSLSHFEQTRNLFDEKECIAFFEALKDRNADAKLRRNLIVFFQNMIDSNSPCIAFLYGSAVNIVYEILCEQGIDASSCHEACLLLHSVMNCCKRNDREAVLEANSTLLENILSLSDGSAERFLAIWNVLCDVSFSGCSSRVKGQMKSFMMEAIHAFRENLDVLNSIFDAIDVVTFIFSQTKDAKEVCSSIASSLAAQARDPALCESVVSFLCCTAQDFDIFSLVEEYLKSDHMAVTLHWLSFERDDVGLLLRCCEWLSVVCSSTKASRQLYHMNVYLALFDILAVACRSLHSELASYVLVSLKCILTASSSASHSNLSAFHNLIDALSVDWPENGILIYENCFEVMPLFCQDTFGTSVSLTESDVNTVTRVLAMRLKHALMDGPVATAGCTAIGGICAFSSMATSLGSEGVCTTIVALLELHKSDENVIRAGTRALAELTLPPNRNIDLVSGESFKTLLIDLFNYLSCEETCKNVLQIILNHEEQQSNEIFHSIFPKLLECLEAHWDSEKIFSLVCKATGVLGRASDMLIQQDHFIRLLLQNFSNFRCNIKAGCSACEALGEVLRNASAIDSHLLGSAEEAIHQFLKQSHFDIKVGASACLAVQSISKFTASFSTFQFYSVIMSWMRASKHNPEDWDVFLQTASALAVVGDDDASDAESFVSQLQQCLSSKDKELFSSILSRIHQFGNSSLARRLALERSELSEILTEALSVWREHPKLIGSVLKSFNIVYNLVAEDGVHYNVNTAQLLEINIPNLIYTLVKEMWNYADVVVHGVALLAACFVHDGSCFTLDRMPDVLATLFAILERHTQVASVVDIVCEMLRVTVESCVQYFETEKNFVPLVDAIRIHMRRQSSMQACIKACLLVDELLRCGEASVALSFARSEFSILLTPLLSESSKTGDSAFLTSLLSILNRLLMSEESHSVLANLVQDGGCALLVGMLNAKKDGTVMILRNISLSTNANTANTFVECGVFPALLKTVDLFRTDASVCDSFCQCVKRYLSPEIHPMMTSTDEKKLCDVVVSFLSNEFVSNKSIKAEVMTNLCMWTEVHPSILSDYLSLDMIAALVSTTFLDCMFFRGKNCGLFLLEAYLSRVSDSFSKHCLAFVVADVSVLALAFHQRDQQQLFSVVKLLSFVASELPMLFDAHTVESLCRHLEALFEGGVANNQLLACELCTLLSKMSSASSNLPQIVDSSLCESVTEVYDRSDSQEYRRICITFWKHTVNERIAFFLDSHITYRLVSYMEACTGDEDDVFFNCFSILSSLLQTSMGGEEFKDIELTNRILAILSSTHPSSKMTNLKSRNDFFFA